MENENDRLHCFKIFNRLYGFARGTALPVIVLGAVMMVNCQAPPRDPLSSVAERYVKLVLAVGQHDADYVDAFYGPAEWRSEAEAENLSLEAIDRLAHELEKELKSSSIQSPTTEDGDLWMLRTQYIATQLAALRARVAMLQGMKMTFDEESKALYDAVAPTQNTSEFESVLKQLDAKLPDSGPLIERYDHFKQDFVIPTESLDRVFQEAIRACRERTIQHIELPPEETFTVEYVTDKSWSGYNWYQGNYRSLIQVNTDLPIYIDRAIDLACHEGYPGHHVYHMLIEKHLVRDRDWIEFTVYPLFSPQSLISEGTANYGIELAFSPEERISYEKDVLFPMAGLDPMRTEEYYDILELMDKLSYAGNEAARLYLNGTIDSDAAADFLAKYAMFTRPRAEQRVRFIDQYRSYVINYNLGKDLVRTYIVNRTAADHSAAARWREFVALLSSPRLPSGLK
jgi:hypothetical protein